MGTHGADVRQQHSAWIPSWLIGAVQHLAVRLSCVRRPPGTALTSCLLRSAE